MQDFKFDIQRFTLKLEYTSGIVIYEDPEPYVRPDTLPENVAEGFGNTIHPAYRINKYYSDEEIDANFIHEPENIYINDKINTYYLVNFNHYRNRPEWVYYHFGAEGWFVYGSEKITLSGDHRILRGDNLRNGAYYNGYNSLAGGEYVQLYGSNGGSTLSNYCGAHALLVGGAGDDSIYNDGGDSVTIIGGAGDDSIYNYGGSSVTIDGGAGNDSIYNDGGYSVKINGGADNDAILNSGSNVTIDGGDGNDTITNWSCSNVTIIGGAGMDKITNHSKFVTIDAGNDSDSILIENGSNISVNAGDGNDSITNKKGS